VFSDKEFDLNRLLERLPQDVPYEVVEEPDPILLDVLNSLDDAFKGKNQKGRKFNVNLRNVSSYFKKVLNYTQMVPVGYVTTYGALANVAGGSARSVGRVQATNPVPLLIPCHRVVRSDLDVGGYGYGPEVKMEILRNEDRGYEESTEIDLEGKKLRLFPVKWVKLKLI